MHQPEFIRRITYCQRKKNVERPRRGLSTYSSEDGGKEERGERERDAMLQETFNCNPHVTQIIAEDYHLGLPIASAY